MTFGGAYAVLAYVAQQAPILALAAALTLFRFKLGVMPILLGCSLAGVVLLLGFGGVR